MLYRADSGGLMWTTFALTAANIWSHGVMHNHAVDSARGRSRYSGGFHDFRERDLTAIPNWLATLNMVTSAALLMLLLIAVAFMF